MTTNPTTNPPTTWKDTLGDRIPEHLAREIEVFENQIALKREGRLADEVFAEMRLRRGVYGQRYDNGQRHNGIEAQSIELPSGELLKGPNTLWNAPGMQRIKIPFGAVTAEQMEILADLADEVSDGILHVTTRQDIQLHFVHIDDTPDLMRRLAAVGITTREACGNSVRNVTACPLAGVCSTESFDVTPYARATTQFLLGHPDAQEFGRKFKIAFSGCGGTACGLARMHDIGAIARTRKVGGREQRGFELYVGGGLGSVPQQAKLFDPFLPEEELLPISQAICRVFARLGEKKNRSRARLKFLISKLGIEEFRRLVLEERSALPPDPRWTALLEEAAGAADGPREGEAPAAVPGVGDGFEAWRATNVSPQRQEGYSVALVTLPLGDATSDQFRELARIARRFTGDTVRTTVGQNLAFRWVRDGDLPALHAELAAAGLGSPGAETLIDVTACPGTDTCKLGIASSRGLAGELRRRLAERAFQMDAAVRNLRIKVSGCFNSCGQHHAADIGFWGVNRKVGGHMVPHFQVVLGGEWGNNVGSFGVGVGAVPSKNIPKVVDRITEAYLHQRQGDEGFQVWVQRVGKGRVRALLEDLCTVPAFNVDPSFYSDWGDPRVFTTGDIGVGECAGQVVSPVDFGLQSSERELFEALDRLDQGDLGAASELAYRAMLLAARTLARTRDLELGEDPDAVVASFKKHLHDTGLFHDPYAKGKFAQYLFRHHEEERNRNGDRLTPDAVRQRLDEAQLFVEAAYSCHLRMNPKEATP